MAANQVSAQARGVVVVLQGNAWIVNPDGSRKALRLGDEVQEGQVIATEDGTRLELAMPHDQLITVESGRELLIDANLLGTIKTDPTETALKDLNSGAEAIAKVLASGTGDLSAELDATAAGLSGGDASDSHSFVRVLRINEELTPLGIQRDNNQQDVTEFDPSGVANPPTTTASGTTTPPGSPSVSVPDENGAGFAGNKTVAETDGAIPGEFTVSAPAGLASISVGGTTLSAAQLAALGTTPVSITTTDGTLVLNGYAPATGKVSYTFDPVVHSSNASVTAAFPVTVTDSLGATSTANNLDIVITDSKPVAVNDAASITEDAATNTVSGSVLTGTGADTVGADTNATPVTPATVTLSYGSLVLNANGSYTYTLDNSNATVNALNDASAPLTDTYTYTITDGDGSTSTATLTISINGHTDGSPSVSVPDENGAGFAGNKTVAETDGAIPGE
ncbi:retention module-containing protein, partial [Rhodoferax saidenbachensis]